MIRTLQKQDLEDVLATWEAASRVGHQFLSEEFLRLERQAIPDQYLPAAETWVWETSGRVVGFISLLGHEVGALFVDPRFHGLGIGHALMDHVWKLHGVLEVEVFMANTIGRAFYERYGFTLMHEKVHVPTGFTLLRLRLQVN